MMSALEPLRPLARRALGSDLGRSLKASPGFLPFRLARRGGAPIEADIGIRMGMGAILAHAIRLWAWAEDNGVALTLRSSCPLYSDNGDFLARFLDPAALSTGPRTAQLAASVRPGRQLSAAASEWMMRYEMPRHISLPRASDIAARHLRPGPALRAELARLGAGGPFDMAIHFRGTDKFRESGAVDIGTLKTAAAPYLARATRVFLATDIAEAATAIRTAWPQIAFVSYDLGTVADGQPRHFSDLPADEKAREALVNIFMIADAPLCVRTSSYMSSLARVLNPDQRTITINRTLTAGTPFPERQILEHESAGVAME